MLEEKLQIYLITYNRKEKLKETLDSILNEESPVRNFSITILDNASTDGTTELIDEYCKSFSNLTHVRHSVNIGGNANICRAFELSASCNKEYAWILCDDDKYDFSNWNEVEYNVKQGKDLICLCDYAFLSPEDKNNPAYQLFQMTFVPSIIYKTKNITNTVLMNMYDAILFMFQQCCLTINVINNNGSISVLSKPIVYNGIHFKDKVNDTSLSYIRGADDDEVIEYRKSMNWIIGFINILSLLSDESLKRECIEIAIPHQEIYKSWYKAFDCIYKDYFNTKNINNYYTVLKSLRFIRQIEMAAFLPVFITKKIITWIFSIKNTKDRTKKVVTVFGFKFYRERLSN